MSHRNNILADEARQYEQWEREQKNRILRMANEKRKQEEWDKLFPRMEHNDDWMEEAVMF